MNIKKLVRFIVPVAAILAIVAALPVPAHAQFFFEKMFSGDAVSRAVTADDTAPVMVIKYIGSAIGGGEVTVAAAGDITLTVGGVADITTECPVAGAYGGVITVADASCNSLGEVVDSINFSANWRAYLVGGLRADAITANSFLAAGPTTTDAVDGTGIFWDTDAIFVVSAALTPPGASGAPDSFNWYNPDLRTGTAPSPIQPNPVGNHRTAFYGARWWTTYGAGTSALNVYAVKRNFARGRLNAAGTGFTGGSEVVRLAYSHASGATTVEVQDEPFGVVGNRGELLVVRVENSAAMSVVHLEVLGSYFVP